MMGMTDYLYNACQAETWEKEISLGDKKISKELIEAPVIEAHQ